MLCDNCKERDAVINLTQVEHDNQSHAPPVRAVRAAEGASRPALRCSRHRSAASCRHDRESGNVLPTPPTACAARLRQHAQGLRDRGGWVRAMLRLVRAALRDLLRRLPAPASTVASATSAGCGGRDRSAAPAARAPGAAATRRRQRELELAAELRTASGCSNDRPHPAPDGGMGWLDASGPKGGIVLSTRIALARNLDGYVFGQRAKDADRTACSRVCRKRVLRASCCRPRWTSDWTSWSASIASSCTSGTSCPGAGGAGPRGAAPTGAALVVQGTVGVMVNEEDPLTIARNAFGIRPRGCYADLEGLDADLGGCCPSRFTPNLAILRPAPPTPGRDSGERAYPLAGPVLTKEVGKVLQGSLRVG